MRLIDSVDLYIYISSSSVLYQDLEGHVFVVIQVSP